MIRPWALTGFLVTSRSITVLVFGLLIKKEENFLLVNHGNTKEMWWC